MRIFKGLWLALALALGASAQVLVRPVPVIAPLGVPGPVAPAIAGAASIPFAPSAALPSLTPALAPAAIEPRLLVAHDLRQAVAPVVSPAAAAQNALESGDYGALFDGAAAGEDGAAVHARLVDPKPNLSLPMQLAIVRGNVERALPALRESVALGAWVGHDTTLSDPACGDAAPKLAALLRARGLPVRLVEAEFHYYVILDLPEAQIVIDPTIRQFFGRRKAPRAIPDVFVGTLGELGHLFANFKQAKTTRYDTSRIYFSEARSREGQLAQLQAEILRGDRLDLDPLRAELGLPKLTRGPRLIIP